MDDPGAVGLDQPVGHLGHHFHAPPLRQPRLDGLAQGLAVDVLHGDVVHFVPARGATTRDRLDIERRPGVPDFVDRDDVRVAEGRGRARLVREPAHAVAVVDEIGRQHLQRHVAVERPVVSPVDVPHRPAPRQCDDPVPADVRADRERFCAQGRFRGQARRQRLGLHHCHTSVAIQRDPTEITCETVRGLFTGSKERVTSWIDFILSVGGSVGWERRIWRQLREGCSCRQTLRSRPQGKVEIQRSANSEQRTANSEQRTANSATPTSALRPDPTMRRARRGRRRSRCR